MSTSRSRMRHQNRPTSASLARRRVHALLLALALWSLSASAATAATMTTKLHIASSPAAADRSMVAAIMDASPGAASHGLTLRGALGPLAGEVSAWQNGLATADGKALTTSLALGVPPAKQAGASSRLSVEAGQGLRSSVTAQLSKPGTAAKGYARVSQLSATLSGAAGAGHAHVADGTDFSSTFSIKLLQKIKEADWQCPGSGPSATEGVAQGEIHATYTWTGDVRARRSQLDIVRGITRPPVHTSAQWTIDVYLTAFATPRAALKSYEYKWVLTGPGNWGSYTEYVTTGHSESVARASVTNNLSNPGASDGVLAANVRTWVDTQARYWAQDAHTTWDAKHRCVALKGPKHKLHAPAGIPHKVSLYPESTGGDKTPVKQTITIASNGPLTVSPQSAVATAAKPATFTITNDQTSDVNAVRRANATGSNAADLHIVGVSDDGRSVLDEPVDTAPPTVTVYSYTESQNATGSDAAFSGQGSLTIGMASQAPYSDQNDQLNCQPADQTPLYDAAATDHLADMTGAAYACSNALWIGDQTWNIDGSGTYTDPEDPSHQCSDSYAGQFPLTGTATRETVYLLYDADGNLTGAFLDALPGGFAGDIDYNPAPAGSFSSSGSVLPEPLAQQETCYGTSAAPYPETDYALSLPDVSAGKQLSVSLSKAGSAGASGTPDGGSASVNYNFSLKTVFKIDNAGDPAHS